MRNEQAGDNFVPLEAVRTRAEALNQRAYWRSLRELAASPELQPLLADEFPPDAAGPDGASRREMLRLMAASLALAGFTGCTRQPTEKIVPYVDPPEIVVPGRPLFFATAMPLGGRAIGLLVESHLGRPVKVEGNPKHPASLGATDAFAQASLLTLYDPDRSQVVTQRGQISSWTSFLAALAGELDNHRANRGARLRLLTETVSSPTLASQIQALLAAFPAARWHQYEPVNRDYARQGALLAFGRDVQPHYRLDRAERVVSLGADFCGPANIRYAHDFALKRRPAAGQPGLSRLYAVETMPTGTGAIADHRLPVRATEMETVARALAQALGVSADAPQTAHGDWIAAVSRDLQQHRGASLVIVGDEQPPAVHALAHLMNHALGSTGQTVFYTDPIDASPVDQTQSLSELVGDMQAGRVDLLVILGANPVYTAPADLDFAGALNNVRTRIRLGLYDDETSRLCHWHIPEAHYLETWGDARGFDGTASMIQPLIVALYGGRSAHEFLAALLGQPDKNGYDIVREYWRGQKRAADFEKFWRAALHEGFIPDTALPPKQVVPKPDFLAKTPLARPAEGLEIVFRPDPSVWDGRFANNGWLQELPKPITKLTWDNAAMLSPATAQRLGVANEDMVELRYSGRSVRAPVWIVPGHADDSVTVHLGYGRERAGRVGSGAGFNAYALRTAAPWAGPGLELRKTGQRGRLATTQEHHLLEGRGMIRAATLEAFRKNPKVATTDQHENPSLYPEYEYRGYAWGMVIDLNACLGCNACVAACNAENNVPVVGKDQVWRGREMHWLRIDTYHVGDPANPETYFEPMLCQHCENAPCEVVCPVNATVHSSEGLNEMVYNRCVGTRYCSNNCPYKVRRFNFYLYSDWYTPTLKMMRNPDVSVRSRGVMEKCTYCVQRINAARIDAKREDRRVRDGEVVTACQAACPAQAIVFGDINDPNSRVAQLKRDPRNYAVLHELNTQPRTTYLAAVRNPNPEIKRGA